MEQRPFGEPNLPILKMEKLKTFSNLPKVQW